MNPETVKRYRENRKPRAIIPLVGGAPRYHYPSAVDALRWAKEERENPEYLALERADLARVEWEPEPEWFTWKDLEGDAFDPEYNFDLCPRHLARAREEYREKIERDGVWYVCAQVWNPESEEWETIDSVGMIDSDESNNPTASGYRPDLERACVDYWKGEQETARKAVKAAREEFRALAKELRVVALPDRACSVLRERLATLREVVNTNAQWLREYRQLF